jgi:hypothetical protein
MIHNPRKETTMDDDRQRGGMRLVIRLAEKLNIADVLAPVRAELAKVDVIDRRVDETVKVGRDAHARAVAALASGAAPDPADLAAALTLAPSHDGDGTYPPALAGIKQRARAAVHQTAWALGLILTDELHARMVEIANGAVAAAGKSKLPPGATDTNALFRDPPTAAAYAKVTQAAEIFWAVHRLGDQLRAVQWLDELGEIPAGYLVFKHPHKRLTFWQSTPGEVGQEGSGAELLTAEMTDNVMATSARRDFAPPLYFWHAIRVGAEPGLYDIADAGKRFLAYASGRRAPDDLDIKRLRSRVG